ncbi:MAG: hypothetical protein F2793_06900 [Actinobacteria bacterium]|uniref:Unannotated protein n=1 Tax=freshwater metagenome TaxID=449393 RepID=A0A6J7EQM3_9ZZZZ|nr:hypothetical protein [Actinomycetota bacterium]
MSVRVRSATALAPALGLFAAASLVASLATPTTALATTATATALTDTRSPTGWQQLSHAGPAAYPRLNNVDEPTLARIGTGLQVIWPVQIGASQMNYETAILNASGALTTRATPIITGWTSLTADPRVVTISGSQFLAFSGLRTTDASDPYALGSEYSATSADGLTWTLGAGAMSESTSAYADYGNDAVDSAGTPVWVGNPGTVTGVRWQSGTASSIPAPPGTDGAFDLSGCCAYSAAAARDNSTGAIVAAFYSNSSAASEQGIQVGQILPTSGGWTRAPGSAAIRAGQPTSLSPDQRIAMVSRPAGGVLVAYKVGYPTTSKIRVWQVGTHRTIDIPGSSQASKIAMASGPDGGVWVAWLAGSRVKIARVTAAGAVGRSIITWRAPSGTSSAWKIAASSGAPRRLDVVITATGARGAINVWHRQAVVR